MKKLLFRFIIFTQLLLILIIATEFVVPYSLTHSVDLLIQLFLYPVILLGGENSITILLLSIYGICVVYGSLFAIAAWLFCKINKLKLPQQSWRILSYSQKLLISQLLFLIAFVILLAINASYEECMKQLSPKKILTYMSLTTIACIATSLLWHWADKIKNKNRTKAKILFLASIFTFLLVFTAIYFIAQYEVKAMRTVNDSGYYEAMDGTLTQSDENDGDDYDGGYEGEEDGYDAEWEGPMRDDDFVDSSFRYILQEYGKITSWAPGDDLIYIADTGYIRNQQSYTHKKVDDREKFINSIGMYINRDQDRLMQFYYTFSDVIYKYVPWKEYKTEARSYVKLLLRAYDNCSIKDGPDEGSIYEGLMYSLYNKMIEKNNYTTAEEHYTDISNILEEYDITSYKEELELFEKGTVVWAYTFWARRNHEGNYPAAIFILNKINEHYNEIEEEYGVE